MNNIQSNKRLEKLRVELDLARARSKEHKAELAKVQRKVDRAENRVTSLLEEIDQCEMEHWGGQPNWAMLLQGKTQTTYHALDTALSHIGLHFVGAWMDTGERSVMISINSGEANAVERNTAAIDMLMPHMKPHQGDMVWFRVACHQPDSAWTLKIHRKTRKATLVQEVYGTMTAELKFETLELALAHVQQNLWAEDVLDMPASEPLAFL